METDDRPASELWDALNRFQDSRRYHVALLGYGPALKVLEELPCHWAVPCGERERMRKEPPDPCVRCKALADARAALLEALNGVL